MRISFSQLTVGLALATALTLPAAAAECTVLKTIDGKKVAALIEQGNMGTATLSQNGSSLRWKPLGNAAQTTLYIGEDGENLQFHTAFSTERDISLSAINAWNQNKRFSRTYLDDEKDPHLELDLDLTGGVCEDNVRDFLKTARVSLLVWLQELFIGDDDADAEDNGSVKKSRATGTGVL